MKNKKLKKDVEEEEIPPFSSDFVVDYFDKIEELINNKPKGRPSKKWIDEVNRIIEDCEKLRKKVLPSTMKGRVYNKL